MPFLTAFTSLAFAQSTEIEKLQEGIKNSGDRLAEIEKEIAKIRELLMVKMQDRGGSKGGTIMKMNLEKQKLEVSLFVCALPASHW